CTVSGANGKKRGLLPLPRTRSWASENNTSSLFKVPLDDVARVMNALPPANKVQQVESVGAQGGVCQTADVFAIQVMIDPADLPASRLLDDPNRTLGGVGSLLDEVELHG